MSGSNTTLDDVFRAVSDCRRRRLLSALGELDPEDAIAIPDDLTPREGDRESLHVKLYHVHLPVLEEMGYVRWDRTADRVARGPDFDEVREVVGAPVGLPETSGQTR